MNTIEIRVNCYRCGKPMVDDLRESIWGFDVAAFFCPYCEASYPLHPSKEVCE